jgi:hypothetical protein
MWRMRGGVAMVGQIGRGESLFISGMKCDVDT